ncbi:hypothetical protein [Facklamia lactis]|uniref:hypothetical protein n=1 Tax=Facklamia lactis TaxID=2749967 RepID=UPI0018CE028F|nr:hypothetical protein [Facklamia lactis]MBG9981037.1 hypothetical protein [Facklamia lactis]
MGIKRLIDVDFWEDPKIIDHFSIEDRYFYLYLMTNPNTSQLGIYQLPIKTISDKTGFTREVVLTLLERFEKVLCVIKYNYETQEIALIESLRHSIIKGGVAVAKLLEKELSQVKDLHLIEVTLEYNRRYFDISSRSFDRKIRDLLAKEIEIRQNYLERPQSSEALFDNENEKHKDNDKDKDKPLKEREASNQQAIQALEEDPLAFHDQVVNNPDIELDEEVLLSFRLFCNVKQLSFTQTQLAAYTNWLHKLPFEMVREAILRSLDKQDIFTYSMKILWNWQRLGLTSLFHVREYEEADHDPDFL